ncbi:MAG: peroxidase-related enzyme [Pseudomonadota bacterium]
MKDQDVCWVEFEPETTQDEAVRAAYGRLRDRDGHVHNLYKAMSLSPDAIAPADDLYRHLLHGESCPLERWLRELLATQVAIIGGCAYALAHHAENFHDLFGDRTRSEEILECVRSQAWDEAPVDAQVTAALRFNDKLTRAPENMRQDDAQALRRAGFNDREIVYLAQISAAFAYWIRTINALGISLGDESVGLAQKPQS